MKLGDHILELVILNLLYPMRGCQVKTSNYE